MKERCAVFVNGKPVEVYRGMKVKHALIAYDYAVYELCKEGRYIVRNGDGFVVGTDGGLSEGAVFSVDASTRLTLVGDR
jgi:hypothetical protein